MNCPKCKKHVEEGTTVCPHCKKVLTLVCPICGTHNETTTCSNCNYVIVSKCLSCGKLNATEQEKCSCGTSTVLSVVRPITELERFAALTIAIGNINKLSKILGAKSLVTKFLFKLKSLITSFAIENKAYCFCADEKTFILSFINNGTEYASALNSMKSSIKLLNILCNLNRTLKKELMFSLEIRFSIEQKFPKDFFSIIQDSNKIKLLDLYSDKKNDFKGLQIITDQFIYKLLRKEYELETLYSTERENEVVSYYSLNLEKYIVPASKEEDTPEQKISTPMKVATKREVDYEQELFKKNIEGIKVACKFEQLGAEQALEFLKNMNFSSGNRIISLRGDSSRHLPTKTVMEILSKEVPCYTIICTETLQFSPWEFFRTLINEIFSQNNQFSLGKENDSLIKALRELVPPQFENAEDARQEYKELFILLLKTLPRAVIYIENFDLIDIASMHILEEIFSSIEKTKLSFVITNSRGYALQKQIPGLLKNFHYIEIFLGQMDIISVLNNLLDSKDFRESFYYKKIFDNAGASFQYCVHAINYLKDCGIIVNFNNKTVLTDSKTVILPFGLEMVINTRLKRMSKDAERSLILAYSYILGPVIEISTLSKLGLYNPQVLAKLEEEGFIKNNSTKVFVQNFETIKKCFKINLKPEVLKYLASNLLNKVYTESSREYPVISSLEYLEHLPLAFSKLYEFSVITLQFGDYDTYLKICIKLLQMLKMLDKEISAEEISEYQADFYNNLTQLLYRYAPERIYPIAESLLQKAIDDKDDEKIKVLSNMMLQGGLLTSNYTNSTTLLQNIMERTPNCTLQDKKGNINQRVFMLSLVSAEIHFYTGYYAKCNSICESILALLTPENLEQLTPEAFSIEQFASHIETTFTYYILSNLLTGNSEIKELVDNVKNKTGLAMKTLEDINLFNNYLQGVEIDIKNLSENIYAKLFKAIIELTTDYAKFATDIYQFKNQAESENLTPLILLGDLLIGFSYKKIGALNKAEHIFNNVYLKSKQCSLYFITHLAGYFMADLNIEQKEFQSALQIITNSITLIERSESPCLILLYLLKNCFVKIIKEQKFSNIDISTEEGFMNQLEKKYPNFKLLLK